MRQGREQQWARFARAAVAAVQETWRQAAGQRREVLVEKWAKRGELMQSRTRDHKTVLIPGDETMIGRYVTVELTGTTGSTFTGALVTERIPLPMAG